MGWIILILALMIPLIAVVLDSPLGHALAEYVRGRGSETVDAGGANKRLATLETEVERLNAEVLRLEEETTFLHKLLESKPQANPQIPPGPEPS